MAKSVPRTHVKRSRHGTSRSRVLTAQPVKLVRKFQVGEGPCLKDKVASVPRSHTKVDLWLPHILTNMCKMHTYTYTHKSILT